MYCTRALPGAWYSESTPDSFKLQWFRRIKDLIDNYKPDLLHSDGSLPFGDCGRCLLAHFYNSNESRHGGKLDAVYNCKFNQDGGEFAPGSCVQDLERGVQDGIKAFGFAYQLRDKTVLRGGHGIFRGFLGPRRFNVVLPECVRFPPVLPRDDGVRCSTSRAC